MLIHVWQSAITVCFLTGVLLGLPAMIVKNYRSGVCGMPLIMNLPLWVGSMLRFSYFIWSGQLILAVPDAFAIVFAGTIELQRQGLFLKKV